MPPDLLDSIGNAEREAQFEHSLVPPSSCLTGMLGTEEFFHLAMLIHSKESGKKKLHSHLPEISLSIRDGTVSSYFLFQQGLDAEGAEVVKFMSPHLRELSPRKCVCVGGQPNKQVSPETRQLSSCNLNKIEN